MLRCSEIVFKTNKVAAKFILKANHITFLDSQNRPTRTASESQKVCIFLSAAKNDQFGKGVYRVVSADPKNSILCPVRATWKALLARQAEPTLPFAQGHQFRITSASIARIVKKAGQAAGLDPVRFSTISLRSGGATHLLKAGVDPLVIRLHGRWLSDAFTTYTVISADSMNGVTDLLLNKTSHHDTTLGPSSNPVRGDTASPRPHKAKRQRQNTL